VPLLNTLRLRVLKLTTRAVSVRVLGREDPQPGHPLVLSRNSTQTMICGQVGTVHMVVAAVGDGRTSGNAADRLIAAITRSGSERSAAYSHFLLYMEGSTSAAFHQGIVSSE
jgi:hypothetical protein